MAYLFRKCRKIEPIRFNESLVDRLIRLSTTLLRHSRLLFKPSIPPPFLVNVGAIHACKDRTPVAPAKIAEVYGARDSFQSLYISSLVDSIGSEQLFPAPPARFSMTELISVK